MEQERKQENGFVYDYQAGIQKKQQTATATSDFEDRYKMHGSNAVSTSSGKVIDVIELQRHYFSDDIFGWTLLDDVARVRREEDLPYGFSQERVIFHEGWHNAKRPEFEHIPTEHEANTHAREYRRPPVRFNYTGSAAWRNTNYGIDARAY